MKKYFTKNFDQDGANYDQRLVLPGLDKGVMILRDQLGIPHIMAETLSDGFFGQGYVHAQDRLWQMESDRLRAYGKMAEVLGIHTQDQDVFWRRLGLESNAREDFHHCSVAVQQMFISYAHGVNAYLSGNTRSPECVIVEHYPLPWNPWDSIAVFKSRHLAMGRWEHKMWRLQVLQKFGLQALSVLYPLSSHFKALSPDLDHLLENQSRTLQTLSLQNGLSDSEEGGSNNWVLAGARTKSGKPLLAGDPHRAVEVPNVYYQNHIMCPEFNVIGFSFPGTPGIPHFGHNEWVAWSITHTAADTQDVFIEELNLDKSLYRRGNRWKNASIRDEVIHVRNAASIVIQAVDTDNGPVVDFVNHYGLALKLAALQHPNKTWETLFAMLFAKNTGELDTSMQNWVDPVNNLLYADVHGHIGYRMRGKLPLRSLANAWVPVRADDAEYAWQDFVPFASMPRITDPSEGFIVTANNQVYDDAFPYYVALDFAADHRATRIKELILSQPQWDVTDMVRIHADIQSKSAEKFLAILPMAQPKTPEGMKLRDQLLSWNGVLTSDTIVPTIYNTMRKILVEEIMTAVTNEKFFNASRTVPAVMWQFSRLTSHLVTLLTESDQPITKTLRHRWPDPLGYALDETARRHMLKPGPWPLWRDVHVLYPSHPLSRAFPEISSLDLPSISMGGDGDTIQAASYSLSGFDVKGSSVARYAFDLADWDKSGWITPFGTSGVASHPHYADQTSWWSHHQLYPMHFSKESVVNHARYCTTLIPKAKE